MWAGSATQLVAGPERRRAGLGTLPERVVGPGLVRAQQRHRHDAAGLPLAIDHFRYFAGALRAQEGTISQLDDDTVAYHFHEPLGVVGQIIPWNFPLLMAVWKLAPALAGGNAVVLEPAEQTPASVMLLMDLTADLLPPGVVNVVNGFGVEAGKPLASSSRIRKIAFTCETTTGRLIMQHAGATRRSAATRAPGSAGRRTT
jgi:acyl-CoA reductase-like NAD-dependent aldehyde dehydrogenase